MWYLKRLDAHGKLEQLVTCEVNPPKFNNAYKIISKEEYDSLLATFQNKRGDVNFPSDPEILGTAI